MKGQWAVQDRKKGSVLPVSALLQHAAVRAVADHTAQSEPASALTESHFGQDFSQVAVQSPVNTTRSETAQPCALTPRTCPFGGACHTCPVTVQRRATSQVEPTDVPPSVYEVLRSPGQPLDANTRAFMEPRFGHDFSRVRVHADAQAAESAKAVSALAYAVGQDVVFGEGQHAPSTTVGRKLMAHELTHVVQQSNQISAPQGISSPAAALEGEAHAASRAVMTGAIPNESTDSPAESMIMREIISANPSPSGGKARPPAGLTGCKVFLGGRRIDDIWAGTIGGFRHLYIDVHEGPSNYALIEAGPVGPITGGKSGAWVKPMDWDASGIQWDITPGNCPDCTACLKSKTIAYNAAGHPYHYSQGPNSNSFAWWVLNKCGVSISPMFSGWPYLGIDYWQTHSTTAPAPAPSAAPATP